MTFKTDKVIEAHFLIWLTFWRIESRSCLDPLFGDVSDPHPSTLTKPVNRSKPLSRNNIKGSSFGTTIAATTHTAPPKPTVYKMQRQPITSKELSSEVCPVLEKNHIYHPNVQNRREFL